MGFLTLSVYAGDDTVGFKTDSKYLEKVSREEGKQVTNLYDNFIQYNSAMPSKNAIKNPNSGSTSTRGDFYKGNIFVPTSNIGAGVLLGNSEKRPRDVYTNIQPKMQAASERRPVIAT